MGQTQHIPSNNSSIIVRDGWTLVTLHNTVVVEFDAERIILRTGGWDTVTTRARMNQASNQFGLGYKVVREEGATYVHNRIAKIKLGDSVTIDREHYGNR